MSAPDPDTVDFTFRTHRHRNTGDLYLSKDDVVMFLEQGQLKDFTLPQLIVMISNIDKLDGTKTMRFLDRDDSNGQVVD